MVEARKFWWTISMLFVGLLIGSFCSGNRYRLLAAGSSNAAFLVDGITGRTWIIAGTTELKVQPETELDRAKRTGVVDIYSKESHQPPPIIYGPVEIGRAGLESRLQQTNAHAIRPKDDLDRLIDSTPEPKGRVVYDDETNDVKNPKAMPAP